MLDEAKIKAWVGDRLIHYQQPKTLLFVDALPKNNYGKILKTELRAQLDRVSVRVDATLNELWTKSNILGPTIPSASYCSFGGGGGSALPIDADTCTKFGGTTSTVTPDQSPSAAQGLSNVQARLNVPIFSGFGVEANVAMRQRLEDAAVSSIADVRRSTALSVARYYWALRRIALVRDIQQRAIDRLNDGLVVVHSRVLAGLAPPIDENRAKLQLFQRTATREDLNGQLREATVPLAVLLGLDEEIDLIDPPDVPPGLPPSVEEMVASARRGRPDLQRATMQWEAQREAVRIAESGYWPQIGATALLQYGNNQFNFGSGVRSTSSAANPFSNLSGSITVGLTLSINIFDTMNTWSAVRDARFEEARLWLERKRAELVIASDVRSAHAKVLHLALQRRPLEEALAVARDNLVILEARYQNGDALVIEFLNAQVDLTDAEIQLANVTAQLRQAWLELDAALGRLPGLGRIEREASR